MYRLTKCILGCLIFSIVVSCGGDGPVKNNGTDRPSPELTTYSPKQGTTGTTVTIEGSHFSSTASNNTVFFDQETITPTSASSSQLKVEVPGALQPRSSAYQLHVSVQNSGDTRSVPFTVTKSKNPETTVSADKARQSLKAVMENRGYAPADLQSKISAGESQAESNLSLLDYIESEVNDSGVRMVRLPIGPDGNIIPSGAWRDSNSNFCLNRIRNMKGAVKILNFKLNHLADGYDVFAQYIDVETGKIEEQREGQDADLQDAINQAWNKLQTSIGKPSLPCGEKKPIRISIHSNTTEHVESPKDPTSETTDEVKASIEPVYNESSEAYAGSADLQWLSISASDEDCSTPDPARVRIYNFDIGTGGITGDANKLMIQFLKWKHASCVDSRGVAYPEAPPFPFVWYKSHQDEIYKKIVTDYDNKVGEMEFEHIYQLENWNAVPGDKDVLARKEYDIQKQFNPDPGDATITITEKTTIEVRLATSNSQ